MRNPKWTIIRSANHGAVQLPHHSMVIPHPVTGAEDYCHLPDMCLPGGDCLPAGTVRLYFGRCHGTGGFGVHHIWDRHHKGIASCSDAITTISSQVASILCTGADIYHEPSADRGHRVMVLRSSHGVAVVELRSPGGAGQHYSVVTAFGRRNANGSRVGAVL